MVLTGNDGILKIFSGTTATPSGVSRFMEVLFCNMDFQGPIARNKTEEILIVNKGEFDTNAKYIEGPDYVKVAPQTFSFSCRLADTIESIGFLDLVSGVTTINGITLYGWQNNNDGNGGGGTSLAGYTVPEFTEAQTNRYRVEIGWINGTWALYPGDDTFPGPGTFPGGDEDGYVLRYEEVWFNPREVRITEREDALVVDVTGYIFGDIVRTTTMSAGASLY